MAKDKKQNNANQRNIPAKTWKSFLLHGKKPGENSVLRDWAVLLVVSALLFLGFLAMGGFVFWATFFGDGAYVADDVDREGIVVDRIELEEVVGYYESKQNEFEALKENPPSVIDPSE